jgi:probable DNA repair protein
MAFHAGLRVWPTPDVLPWSSWLTREFGVARTALAGGRRLLRPAEAALLWRAIAREQGTEHGLLCAEGLAQALPRSLALAADWGLSPGGGATPESELLRAALRSWERQCRELGVLDPSSWLSLPMTPAAGPIGLAGFTSLGRARTRWLEERGIARGILPGGQHPVPRVHAAADPGEEIRAAAEWARDRLGRDPAARLLVIVPGLDGLRTRVERDFAATLHIPDAATARAAPFALEGGRPLGAYAPVRAALSLLALGCGSLRFAEFSTLLRTPYLALGTEEAATRLDLWLRDHNVLQIDTTALRRLSSPVQRDLGDAGAALLQQLTGLWSEDQRQSDGSASWARSYARQLAAAGWPGRAPLGSDEQQVRQRFDELLGEYAVAGSCLGRHGGAEALAAFRSLVEGTAFEPASDDVPVTISAWVDDPIVSCDGIWVCGCDASRWPAAPAPDAFMPLGLQLEAGIPAASAEGQLALARRNLAAWRAATPELILSYARSDQDAEQTPSSLLEGIPAWQPEAARARVVVPAAAPLEDVLDVAGAAWLRGRHVQGGVRVLELQAECPFRAYAELRLAAHPLTEPKPGVDSRVRGRVLHGALEELWQEWRDSTGLQASDPQTRHQRVRAAVARALVAELEEEGIGIAGALQQAEERRSVRVIEALLDMESRRPPFSVIGTEVKRSLALGASEIGLRLDRVDRLGDGSVAVLDYKSGEARRFDAHADRLRQPQLPGYALVAGEFGTVAAVATVHLRRDGVKWRGAADGAGRLPQLRATVAAPGEWASLLERWHGRLDELLDEYTHGAAAVMPLPGACEHCHLAALCRIDARGLADGTGEDDDDEP